MRLHVDKEADALYLRLDESVIVESEEVAQGVVVDYRRSIFRRFTDIGWNTDSRHGSVGGAAVSGSRVVQSLAACR